MHHVRSLSAGHSSLTADHHPVCGHHSQGALHVAQRHACSAYVQAGESWQGAAGAAVCGAAGRGRRGDGVGPLWVLGAPARVSLTLAGGVPCAVRHSLDHSQTLLQALCSLCCLTSAR